MQVKDNQRNLLKRCKAISLASTELGLSRTKGKRKRGRIEKRKAKVFEIKDTLWKDFKRLIVIHREVETFDTKLKVSIHTEETAYYVSTAAKYTAKEFGKIIRSHWSIENSNHYVRDVTLGEDASRVRKNPMIMATLRSFALNLLRRNKEQNISLAIYRNAINLERVLKYKGI